MLMLQKNINWNNVPTKFKRGSACIKNEDGWKIDNEMPELSYQAVHRSVSGDGFQRSLSSADRKGDGIFERELRHHIG